MFHWLHPTGGLSYHLKSYLHRDHLWSSFRENLERLQIEWIKNLPPSQKKTLILCGASGGHTQSQKILNQFSHLIHVDKDPLAKFFFKQRINHPSVEFITGDLFETTLINDLLHRFPADQSSVMWCNVLGQVGVIYSENETQKIFENVNTLMSDRSWMTYHDLYSVETSSPEVHRSLPTQSRSFAAFQQGLKQSGSQRIELIDHLTSDQFKMQKSEVLLWPLTSKKLHFIECGFTASPDQA